MRNQRPFAAVLFALAVLFAQPQAAGAQPIAPSVLTLDQERLFQSSRAAGQISAEIERQAAELAAENREIEAALTAEEIELTETRPTLPPETFRELADAFDEKVQRIRAEQDAKERALQGLREAERQEFFGRILPIIAEIARERGALMVLDRRAVVLAVDSIDITDAVIARIDAEFAPETPPNDTPDADPDSTPEEAPPTDEAPPANSDDGE